MSQLAALLPLYWCPGPDDYEPSSAELEAQRKYLEEQSEREKHTIFSLLQFESLARIESESGALGVKILRDKTGVLHWMDTKVWPFHYPFCVSNLGEKRTLQEFNEQVYTGKDRSMMFATVVGYPGEGQRCICLELNPADPMTDLEALNGFFEDVSKNFQYSGKLYFHPTSAAQVEAIRGKNISLPVMTSAELFGNIKYKLIQAGEFSLKRVRVFVQKKYTEDELNKWVLNRKADEVIVIPSVPNDIPVVAGVVCGEIIPPLCHVALLCQNRKTPCCFVKNCVTLMDKGHFSYSTATARGVIARNGFFFDGQEGEPVLAKSQHVEVPKPNTSVTELIDLGDKRASDIHIVGAKAAQLANVEAIYNQPIFKGTFVIPFHHYEKHVYQNNAISREVAKSLPSYNQIQGLIQGQAIDDELVKSVIEMIKQHNMTSVIFRSSTNAEDLTGFNGAGLYESVPLKGNDIHDPKQVGAAIKKVWASVWSTKAAAERGHYEIGNQAVNMAVLIQPYLDSQAMGLKVHYNGVCITHNVAQHGVKHGFVINCYPGTELRATNHYKNKSPEQVLFALGREAKSIDMQLINTATGQTQSMVTQQDAEKMVQIFGNLHSTMLKKPHKLDDTVALDIEFMVVDNEHSKDKREIVVLQARPYTINIMDTEALESRVKEFALAHPYEYPNSKKAHYWTMYL
jgi:hypothetical protein